MAHKPEFWDIYRVLVDFTEEDLHIQEAEADGFQIADLETIKKYAEEGTFCISYLSPQKEKAVFSGKVSAIPPDIPALFPPSHQ